MNFFRKCHLSALVMRYALFPPRPETGRIGSESPAASAPEYSATSADDIRFYLADPDRAVNGRKELRLMFPGCFALAAPPLLFRLKRRGFSNGRAEISTEGLFLYASR